MTKEEFQVGCENLLASLTPSPDDKLFAAHYADENLLSKLLQFKELQGPMGYGGETGFAEEGNRIWQFESTYMNDPSEGKELLRMLESLNVEWKDSRGNARVNKTQQNARRWFLAEIAVLRKLQWLPSYSGRFTFLSSWTITKFSNGMGKYELDDLNMWRLYGADGHGACLIVPLNHLIEYFPENLFTVRYGLSQRGRTDGDFRKQLKVLCESRIASFNASNEKVFKEEVKEMIVALNKLMFVLKSGDY